ncbi:MAG: ATP-binding cassette domain-containing protein [Chloroflexi bacterium]|nr:ATP-binding cassette domain-containing protein [Chloroflexota bacterium]
MEQRSNDSYITCEDLIKIYKVADLEVVALRGLDLRVTPGELVAIVGASGSGKSTLLNILAGLDLPSAGRATVGQRNLLRMTRGQMVSYRRREVGFIWQQPDRNLTPYLSAYGNVELPLIVYGWPRGKRRQRVLEMLSAMDLTERMHHKPAILSGGEQQRLAVAVALANNPPLLLADEPTGELDSANASIILDLFRSVRDAYGTTIVIVTHDTTISRKVDRVIAIRDGKTSTETFRRVSFARPDEAPEESHEEFVVVDTAGRLQVPRVYLEKLNIKERAKVFLEDDHITIYPEEQGKQP